MACAIQQHHERLDGSGYPAGLAGDQVSRLGRVLMAAEVMSAILPNRENTEARALLSLRLAPGQFDRRIVLLLSSIYHEHDTAIPQGFDLASLTQTAHAIVDRLQRSDAAAARIAAKSSTRGSWRQLAEEARKMCAISAKLMLSTGVLSTLDGSPQNLQQNPSIANELHVVVTELKWRMRALSRHVALRVSQSKGASIAFEELVESLYVAEAPACKAACPGTSCDSEAVEAMAA
ncbi:MAG: HD domain-containing phosphohydrolase [Nevskia sp.]|nr:HD domain-containing phosphohydrolase [Nevskia sp.]